MGQLSISEWLGLLMFFGALVGFGYKVGHWARDRESIGTALKKAHKHGNGDSVHELLRRVLEIEQTLGELTKELATLLTELKVQQAQRTLLIERNQQEHAEFRALFAALTKRIDDLQGMGS